MYSLLKPLLFCMDAERAHRAVFGVLRSPLGNLAGISAAPRPGAHLASETFGLKFPHPVGLAAGLDKNAELLHVWQRLGFSFAEVGTVTPRPQEGNPRPRLFRLPPDRALINRMGFNNAGVEAMARRLERRPSGFLVGANIGKNKDTPNEEAVHDYLICFRRLLPLADYFVVNVSSPNTPGLRELQGKDALLAILSALQDVNHMAKPLLLKIAPDLEPAQLADIVQIVQQTGIAGVVATNTTLSRAGLQTPAHRVEEMGAGGLSGAPVRARSTEVVRYLAGQGVNVIAVGGIDSAAAAREKLEAGARLVQVYTGFIYRGPALLTECLRQL
ncbi:MAG: quinone-dependent dihydroorotate dehydrogenase [Bacteroidetes bacterium]|nr:quinone-dependent dihydroorotate dehydrogenase [Bacteroidota bacterium]